MLFTRDQKVIYKFLTIVIIVYFSFLNCSNPESFDEIPPTVKIIFPLNNSTVSKIISVNCVATDNNEINKIELWVDGISTGLFDHDEPYIFTWNTKEVQDGIHIITVRAYDKSNNKSDSDPLQLNVDNSNASPTVSAISTYYVNKSLYCFWSQNNEVDFLQYSLYKSNSEFDGFEIIFSSSSRVDTFYLDSDISDDNLYFYKVVTKNSAGFESSSPIRTASSFQQILFISYRDHKSGVYLMDINGLAKYPIITTENQIDYPKFSTTGSLFVYQEKIENKWQIKLYDLTLNKLINITNNPLHNSYSPQFTPNSESLLFESDRDGNREICSINIDGSNMQNLTNRIGDDCEGKLNIDGSKIIFHSRIESFLDIIVMNVDGTNKLNLTNTSDITEASPCFSFDDNYICFISDRTGNYEIYLMDINGSNVKRLTTNTDLERRPQFFPDNSKILFDARDNVDGKMKIGSVSISGSDYKILASDVGFDQPSISSDGNLIIFDSYIDGNYEIYMMNSDGENLKNLTNYSETDRSPSFGPD